MQRLAVLPYLVNLHWIKGNIKHCVRLVKLQIRSGDILCIIYIHLFSVILSVYHKNIFCTADLNLLTNCSCERPNLVSSLFLNLCIAKMLWCKNALVQKCFGAEMLCNSMK